MNKMLKSVFTNHSELGKSITKLGEKIGEIADEGRAVAQREKIVRSELSRYVETMEEVCHSSGGLVWYKDLEGRYLFAGKDFCSRFYHIDCCSDVLGLTDDELVCIFKERTGLNHPLALRCKTTDKIVMEEKRQVMFVEMGMIGAASIVLLVKKSPSFGRDGRLKGVVGFALDVSHSCQDMLCFVEAMIKKGRVVSLSDGIYRLTDDSQICNFLLEGFPV